VAEENGMGTYKHMCIAYSSNFANWKDHVERYFSSGRARLRFSFMIYQSNTETLGN
jgi:hypothetical protein